MDQLVRKQTMLCNRLSSDAKELFEKDENEEGGLMLFKVKLGQPRNKQLLRMMEDPEKRKAMDKAELSFYQDTRKEELFARYGGAGPEVREMVERQAAKRVRLDFKPTRIVTWDHRKLGGVY